MRIAKRVLVLLLTGTVLMGCTSNDPYQRTKTGAVMGAIAGGVIGHQLDHGSGAVVGAAIGALAGGAVGNYMDNQQQAFESELAEEQRRHDIEIERMRDGTLKLNLDSEVSFDYNSATVKPAFRKTLNKLARLIKKYDQTVVHIVGHTDSTGSDAYNQQLSEERAEAVADHFRDRGIPERRMVAEGRGETEPRADNRSEAGRQRNRRVEIYLVPVVEGDEERAYRSPHYRY